jgi:peptidoglycan/xylan/chitin deacetylase (PgdA/CDA1 family)
MKNKPKLIEKLKEKGYKFVTITELLNNVKQ